MDEIAEARPPLTACEKNTLNELEDLIERHITGFVAVGEALMRIQEGKLYRETHRTFEWWCKSRFGMSRTRAYQLVTATKAHHFLEKEGVSNLPTYENQTRPLGGLESEDLKKVWLEAVDSAGDDPVSERHVRAAVREHNRQEKAVRLIDISMSNRSLLGVRMYPVILADPPWQYNTSTTDPSRQIENQYPTMDLESICKLPVESELATDDAVLFLWATAPFLQDALAVMNAWGFTYKTNAVWDKLKIGMGYWLRGQHELLLIGVRGDPPKPAPGVRASSVISSPRGEHSVKPVEVYELIESYYPELPKVEMFARNTRPGWRAWGNQA